MDVPHEHTDWPWKIPLRRQSDSLRAYTLVDEDIYRRLSALRCSLTVRGYATAFIPGIGRGHGPGVKGAGHGVLIHRLVLGLVKGDGLAVDHVSGDMLDNRRSNLRLATQAQNMQNKRSYGQWSRYRGVCWDKTRGKWVAYVKPPGGKMRNLGRFDDEEAAARVAAAAREELLPFTVEDR